jgi:hypothetical protein
MFRFTSQQKVWGFFLLGIAVPFQFAVSGDMSLRITPQPTSNGWNLILVDALPSHAYTLVSSPDLNPETWQDTAVIQAGPGSTFVSTVPGTSPDSARFFKIRESSLEDFDGDGLDNRSEFNVGSDPVQSDTDHDLFSDYEEINLTQTDPCRPGDGIEAIEDTRRLILAKWAMIYPSPPAFTNQPGTPADLVDLENLLRQLSGVFFMIKE